MGQTRVAAVLFLGVGLMLGVLCRRGRDFSQ